MTCDDCYFSELCLTRISFGMGLDSLGHEDDKIEKSCKHFKNKKLIVELPCKVGDTIYMFGGYYKGIKEETVEAIKVYEDRIELMYDPWEGVICEAQQIGHTGKEYSRICGYYLSREDAERALRERDKQ